MLFNRLQDTPSWRVWASIINFDEYDFVGAALPHALGVGPDRALLVCSLVCFLAAFLDELDQTLTADGFTLDHEYWLAAAIGAVDHDLVGGDTAVGYLRGFEHQSHDIERQKFTKYWLTQALFGHWAFDDIDRGGLKLAELDWCFPGIDILECLGNWKCDGGRGSLPFSRLKNDRAAK